MPSEAEFLQSSLEAKGGPREERRTSGDHGCTAVVLSQWEGSSDVSEAGLIFVSPVLRR